MRMLSFACEQPRISLRCTPTEPHRRQGTYVDSAGEFPTVERNGRPPLRGWRPSSCFRSARRRGQNGRSSSSSFSAPGKSSNSPPPAPFAGAFFAAAAGWRGRDCW